MLHFASIIIIVDGDGLRDPCFFKLCFQVKELLPKRNQIREVMSAKRPACTDQVNRFEQIGFPLAIFSLNEINGRGKEDLRL